MGSRQLVSQVLDRVTQRRPVRLAVPQPEREPRHEEGADHTGGPVEQSLPGDVAGGDAKELGLGHGRTVRGNPDTSTARGGGVMPRRKLRPPRHIVSADPVGA